MVTFNSTKKKNTGGGNPSYVGNNQSGYSAESGSDEKNKGGILGGLGYISAGLAAGVGSVGEGIIDLLLAGGGLLTGNVDYAKHVFKDNTVGNWFADVTEDFNPGTGWEFWGNVTHGLGQSSVFLLNLIPGLGQLGTAAFFAGIGSQGISSAAATTGDVGFKEVAYGVASGAVEGALEKAFGGMGKAVKALGGSTMKNITKTAVRKGLVKQVLSDAAGEFGEEFASEYIDTFLQRGFQIDPNKTTSLRDALYAGAVGFTSGAVSAGFANVLKAVGNEREGERVIKNGNSQTLVNTATKVADKLAAQGTNWDRAGEWVKALRGQVDAYNKLSESEKTGMRGKTILGEMKSSLFFAETQSTFDLVKKSIQDSDEQTRATFAEYINKSVEKSKRNGKDYTAADIAKDTDGVAWQLAIYKFVPSLFDLDGAIADIEQESEIADVVARQGGEVAQGANDVNPSSVADATASPEGEALAMPQMAGARPAMQFDLDENAVNLRSEAINAESGQTGAETVQDETAGASTSPTGEFNGEVDLERAKRDAERIIEWERKEAPTVDELNRVRGAVKNFDYLPSDRQMSIVRMMRTSKNVDEQTVRGLANLMSITNKKGQVLAGDVEIRFADGIGERGVITTTSGGKKVILVDSSAKRSETFRGTIAHELVHYLENRKGYKALAAYAYKIAKNEKIQEVEDLYDRHYKRTFAEEARRANPNATEAEIAAQVEERMSSAEYQELVESEVTASIVGEALKSEKFLKRYAQVGEEKGILKTAARFIKGIFNSTKDKDADLSREAQNLAVLFDRALASEVEGEQKSGEKYSFSSIGYSFFGRDDVTIEEFESGAYKQTEGYKAYVAECLSNMRQSRADFNEASAKREIERSIDGIVRVAIAAKNAGYDIYDSAAQRTTKDSKKRLLFSSLEPNSDYFTSSDISTICDKRKNFTEIENEINRIEAERNVPREKRFFADINNFFVLHDILARHGLTTACRQCYVESMRKNLGRMANAFITLVTEENAENKKNAQLYNKNGEIKSGNADLRVKVRELMAEEGIDANYLTFERLTNGENLADMRLQYPLLYEAYNSFYGQSKPKMPKSATPFRFGELTALLTDDNGKINERLVRQIESTGGFRLQSYSDFQIKNYVDVLQVIFEAGTLGLTGHAYTKVPAFLDATANTNLKRNISIFMYRDGDEWKIDRKDSFPYALDKIYDIVDADKSGDTGIIAVSQNDDMSAWIMANDQIAYGIPFHKSGTKMGVVRETVVYEGKREIKGYTGIKDHTRMQSEVYASGADKGKKVKAPINIYSFWDFDSTRMSKKNLIEKNLKAYIDACEEKGYLPKFRDYVMNNEKVLNSTLEYAKKLGAVGADATVSDISFKYKAYTIPYGYYKFLGDFSMFTPDGKASPHEVLSLKNYDFDAAVNFFSDSKKLRINELLQQLDNGPEREKYRKLIDEGKMTITELGQVIKKKRDEVVAEVIDRGEKFDLDPEIEAEIEAKYGDNEFFAAAVRRAYEPDSQSAENTRLTKEQLRENAIEKRKRDFNKVIARAVTIQRQIEKMQKQTEGEVDEAKLKKLKKELKTSLGTIGAMQIELRQMGYEVSAEQRRIERLEAQNENQGEQIRTLKQEKRDLELAERERHILDMAEKQEKARAAKIAAKQKQEIGKVYSEAEFKRDMQDMMDRGLISKFFGGEYMPHIDKAKNNAIAQYIAIRLNTAGSFEAAKKDGIVSVVTNDILRNMYFLDETGEKNYLHSLLDEETMSQFKDMLETDVVSILSNAGELNPYAELMRKFRQLEGEYKTKLAKNNEGEAWGKEFPKVVAEAKRMRNFAVNKKNMAADGVQEVLKAFATLTDESGRLYSGRVDEVMQAALTFFEAEAMRTNSERGQVKDENKVADDSMIWDIDPDLKDAIELFVQLRRGREGTLMNSQELKLVREILSGMRTSLERYNKEKIGGKFVDIDRAAGEKIRFMQTDVKSKTVTSKLLNSKLGRAFRNAYFYEVLSPATVFESLDGYEIGGLLTTLYRDIRMAAQSATDMKARLKDPFVRYVDDKENAWKDEKGHSRSYRQKLNEKKISVDGVNITLGEAINLYMLTKREHAHLGLQEGGFVTYDENGVKVAKIKIPDIEIARNNLYNQFDATDRKFIEMAEDFFNKTASKIKEDADIEIYGYSKNSEGYYVPIVRDHYSRNNGVTDVRQSISNFATVNNKSFTKDLVRNAKPLEGQNILGLIETHADGLADYANLYMPLKAFDRVYNRGVSIDGGEVTTLREQLNEEWNGAHKYFTKLFKDIQGVRDGDPPSNVDKVASWIRSNWVASVLGANLKVVCTQTTSLGAATQIIDAKYVTKASWIITPGTGFAKGVKEIAERADKYSKTIFSRSFDAGAVKAQGNLDKIGKIAKGASTLIGIQDRKVCIALFHAAELSVEASTGHKIGTEENSVLAAKLVDEAILTTQAMESQAEKSNLQRANSELAKLFSMFTSDSVKNLSHLISNISRYAAHKNRAKNGDARYEAELKKDGKAARRSMRTMLITGVMLGVITQGFKYLYGKEEEDEKKLQDFAVDIVSSTVNVFPVISEFVDKIAFDYDMSVNVLDVVNDTLETFGDSFELMGKAMGGEYVSGQAIGKSAINVSKSAFSLFGIPVAPAERTVTGLLRRFSPGTIYGYDSMMYSATYSADLKTAVESGDEALAEHILETLYKNEATGVYSTPELEEVARLYKLGNTSVIPQKIGATVNDVKLDRKQRAQFEKIYGEASAKVNELIRSEYYSELNDEQRAKAIKTLYSLYYNRAAAEVAGVEWSNAQAYSRLTSNYALLFSSQAYKSGLTEYKNLRGKIVSVKDQFVKYVEGLGLSDADKLVILYANGYRDAKTKAAMISYINALSLSDEEKAKIAEKLGFDFKDGKMSEKEKEYEIRA